MMDIHNSELYYNSKEHLVLRKSERYLLISLLVYYLFFLHINNLMSAQHHRDRYACIYRATSRNHMHDARTRSLELGSMYMVQF